MRNLETTMALAILLACAGSAKAEPIIYTETATGSGTLDGVSFNDAQITLTGTGDTANISASNAPSPPFETTYKNTVTLMITVDGLSDTITDPTNVYVIPEFGAVGFTDDANSSGDILNESSGLFSNYQLSTEIGPINSPGSTTAHQFTTTGGYLSLSGLDPDMVSFTAAFGSSASVPEPSSLVLMGFGGLAGLGYARRRRAHVVAG